MSYCGNCGQKLTENDQFCAECGQQVKGDTVLNLEKNEPILEQKRSNHVPSEPLFKSKKSKITAICTAIIFALLVGSYFIVKQMTSSVAIAEEFIEAINKKDKKKVKKFINNGQYEIKADDQQAKEFLRYLHSNPRMITSIIEGLRYEAAIYNNKASDGEPSSYVSLKNKGTKWLFFDDYTVQIPTYYVEISSELEKTDVYVNGEKKGTLEDKEKEFGPFLPGEHDIKAVVRSDYGVIEKKVKINTEDLSGQTEKIEFNWSNHFVGISSNDETAYVFVNNKSTGKKIEELSEVGPIPLDGSVKLFAQRKMEKGIENSAVVTVDRGVDRAELDFEEAGFVYSSEVAWNDESNDTAIRNVILAHYEKISNDEYSAAYDLFSSNRKSTVKLDVWKKGLKENIRDEVEKLENIEIVGNRATADIRMTSYDHAGNGKTLVQEWGGHWKLVRESDGWKLNEAKLDKLASRTE